MFSLNQRRRPQSGPELTEGIYTLTIVFIDSIPCRDEYLIDQCPHLVVVRLNRQGQRVADIYEEVTGKLLKSIRPESAVRQATGPDTKLISNSFAGETKTNSWGFWGNFYK